MIRRTYYFCQFGNMGRGTLVPSPCSHPGGQCYPQDMLLPDPNKPEEADLPARKAAPKE
jgi:hypothetical protein